MPAPVDLCAQVLTNQHLSADYNVLVLAAPEIAAATLPGQFVMIRTTMRSDPLLRRPFSVFQVLRRADGTPEAISILCKRVGAGTALLYDLAAGASVECLGPLGKPFVPAGPPSEAWMVAGGVGLAPFATLAESFQSTETPCVLFYGGRTASDLFYLDWFAERGVRLELATEDGSCGTCGRVTLPLERALGSQPPDRPVTLYACGPEPMLKAVGGLALAHRCRSQLSMERIMGCGLGGCYSCVVRVRDGGGHAHFVRSCLSGPVLNGADVVWE